MMDDKALEEKAWRITNERCEYRADRGRMCRAGDSPSCGPCALVRGILFLSALREVAKEARQEEHAEWLAKSASVADTAKAAFERGREEERKKAEEVDMLRKKWRVSNKLHKDCADLLEKAEAEVERLKEALTDIAKGEGRYNRDPLTHASNTIEDMQALASAALRGDDDEASGTPPDPTWEEEE
jgi:hypothetical protein